MKKNLLCFAVLLIFNNSLYAQVNLQLGLVAYYTLNNTTVDSSNNHLNLTASGTPVGTMNRFGTANAAYNLNSTHPDYFTAALNPLLAPSELTVSAWVNLPNTMNDQKIAGRAVVGAGYLLGVDSNKIDAEIWDLSGTHFRLKALEINPNQWTHLAMSYQANNYLKVYINGAPIDSIPASSSGAGTSATWTFTIGGAPWQPTALNANGSIDDLRLYNRKLNEDEVMALYSGVTGLPGIKGFENLSLYPIPMNNGILHIDFGKAITGNVELTISDALGKIVYSSILPHPEKESIDLSHLKKGLYTISMSNENGIETRKIVID